MKSLAHIYFLMNGSPTFPSGKMKELIKFELGKSVNGVESFYFKFPDIVHINSDDWTSAKLFSILNSEAKFNLSDQTIADIELEDLFFQLANRQDPISAANVDDLVKSLSALRAKLEKLEDVKIDYKFRDLPIFPSEEPIQVCIINYLWEQLL